MGKDRQQIFLLCFFILFFGSFSIWLFFDLHLDDEINLSLRGEKTVAQVFDAQYHAATSRMPSLYSFNYSFTVENKIYTGSAKRAHNPGDSVLVVYLPSDPNIHVEKFEEDFSVMSGIWLITFFLVMVWCVRLARLLRQK
jgi:hypothetical protein